MCIDHCGMKLLHVQRARARRNDLGSVPQWLRRVRGQNSSMRWHNSGGTVLINFPTPWMWLREV